MSTRKTSKSREAQIIKYKLLKIAAGGGGASGGGGPRRPASSLMGQLVRQRQQQLKTPAENTNPTSGDKS